MKKTISIFEIVLLLGATFAFMYMVRESNTLFAGVAVESEKGLVKGMRAAVQWIVGDTFVSAVEGLWTCPVNNQGSLCQEYPSATCASQCAQACVPLPRESYGACTLGTCIDPQYGTCTPNAPNATCAASGGIWKRESATQLAQCRPGCCIMGQQTSYVPEAQCSFIGNQTGIPVQFQPVTNELACLALANRDAEGACVLGETEPGEHACVFGTKAQCTARGGSFHQGLLCSNPQLNTRCEAQASTSCVAGKDEVYWMDSCGNRENIYDALNRDASWNNGRILAKNESCGLALGNNPFARQASCGNCNYLVGSVCGAQRAGDITPTEGNFMCRDLSCTDEWGTRRKQGESWCAFDSKIGVQGTGSGQRSVDLPGSRHYRKACINGEVITEPCADFRNEICSETRDAAAGFSSAACRINQWQKCAEINTRYAQSTQNGKGDAAILNQCSQISDCYLKEVNVDSQFKFSLCVPKSPPGFNLQASQGGEVANSLCSFGTQKCTYVKVKGLFSSSETNANCLKPEFTEKMNDLCMSLGDCGAQVNIVQQYSDAGYQIKNAPKVRDTYIATLKALATPTPNQRTQGLSPQEIAAAYKLDVNDPQFNDKIAQAVGMLGVGATGAALAAHYLAGTGTLAVESLTSLSGVGFSVGSWGPALNAFANVASGAAMGAAIGFLIGKLLGAKGDTLTAATVTGLVTGLAIALVIQTQGSFLGIISVFSLGFIFAVAIVVVIVVIIFNFLGIGKAKKTIVEFQCLPWQAPTGGDKCTECGKNGLPCSPYKCQSLGQACRFLNETGDATCVNVAPDDVSAPLISPNHASLNGTTFVDQTTTGISLRGMTGDGCIEAYSEVQFGIALNEVGQCRVAAEHTPNYAAMESYFGTAGNLYRYNHTAVMRLPSLDALAYAQQTNNVSSLLDASVRQDYTLYVRCQDIAGNANAQEYGINFCLSPTRDISPPVITRFVPQTPAYAATNATSQFVTFYTNEPAECRWSATNLAYDAMQNVASCSNDLEDMTLSGWACNMTLPVLMNSTTYNIKCKDQPWLEGNETATRTRNVATQGASYVLSRTQTPLRITSITPNNQTIAGAGAPVRFTLEARTEGGAPDSIVTCSFAFNNAYTPFFETGGSLHRQPDLSFFTEGSYTLPIRCEDSAGNVAAQTIRFTIDVDSEGPQITRLLGGGSTLTVLTNEAATCRYSLDDCSAAFINGTSMNSNGRTHTLTFTHGATHRVICRDTLGNPSACTTLREGT